MNNQNHPCRSQERPLSLLEIHDEDMGETEYLLNSYEFENLHGASLESNLTIPNK